jgi:hypothetical protein
MATQIQVEAARVRLAFLLRSMLRRVDKKKIGSDRYRNLGTELADYLRAAAVASRTTMALVTSVAHRFEIDLNEGVHADREGDEQEHRAVAAFIPTELAGDLPGHAYEDCRVVPWPILAQHTPLEAVRLAVNDGPDFFVTFAQTAPSPQDLAYFRMPEAPAGERWVGVLPSEDMQSPKQYRAWIQAVSPLAHGHDEKAGNVLLYRRQAQVDPWTGEHSLVPIYTGNAVKGQWRDLFFARMLRVLGLRPETDLTPRRAQELFSGGTIEKGADGATARLDVRRRARHTIPAINLLGGCIEQQILSGLLRVNDVTLLCRENAWKLYPLLKPTNAAGERLTYADFAASLAPADDWTLLRLGVRMAHRDLPGGDLSAKEGGAQALWNTEAIKPGARLLHTFSLVSLSTVPSLAMSCMADLLGDFADTGLLGAQTARGYGQVSMTGYVAAEKAEPLPSPDEYRTYLDTHRAEILDWLRGPGEMVAGPEGEVLQVETAKGARKKKAGKGDAVAETTP